MKNYKLAILISHPIQYHTPLFQALSKDPRIDLMVYYCWDFGVKEKKHESEFNTSYKWDMPLLDDYKCKFLKNLSLKPSSKSFWGQINPGIMVEICRNRYDAIWVHGYSFLTDWLAFFSAKVCGTPIFLRGVTHILDEKPLLVRIVKRIVLPFLFSMCSVCLYIGENNRRYYEFYGVPQEKLYLIPHIVGNEFFRDFYMKMKKNREKFRKKFDLPINVPVILFSGKLIDKKKPFRVLEAYRNIRNKTECALLFAGDGPLREELENRIKKENIKDVHVTGFLNQTEMPEAYISGDILVLPSAYGETWGLVVNEAMNFDLPIIISDKVGCAPDLVHEGKNGYVVREKDFLEEKIYDLVRNPEKMKAFGTKSGDIIKKWSVKECVEGIIKVFKKTYGKNKK